MFQEKFNGLKDLYIYTINELKVVQILVDVINIKDGWLSGTSGGDLHIVAKVEEVYDTEEAAKAALVILIDAERAKLNAAEQNGTTL